MNPKFLDRNSPIESTLGVLPHWHQDGCVQFITFHLCDSLPQTLLAGMQQEKKVWLSRHPQPWSLQEEMEYHHRFSQSVDRWMDRGYGSCLLQDPRLAGIVRECLLFHDGERYKLHAYVIMPNHVHVLIEMLGEFKSWEVMHTWKSFSAHEINRVMGTRERVWFRESYDRAIRDEQHYANVVSYIRHNVMHGGVLWG